MKSILNPVALALFISLAGQAAFAQDTVFVSQVPPPQTAPQEAQQQDYQAAPQAAAPAPTYQIVPQTAPQPVYQAAPQPAPQPIYQDEPQKQDPSNVRRSSFYLNGGLGVNFAYFYYNDRTHNYAYDQDIKTKFDGFGIGLTGEITLGFLIKELIAIHGTVEFSNINGEYDINAEQKKDVDTDIDAMIFGFGPGLTVFPFSRREGFLQGTFVSAKLMYELVLLNMPNTHNTDNAKDLYLGIGFTLEVGKDWHITSKANGGVALRWQIIAIEDNSDDSSDADDDDYHKHIINSLQLVFRINRR
jgi:hypothetical protein